MNPIHGLLVGTWRHIAQDVNYLYNERLVMCLKDLHWFTPNSICVPPMGFPGAMYNIVQYRLYKTIEKRAHSEAEKFQNKQSIRKNANISKKQR